MPLVTRAFAANEVLQLPHDTAIIPVPPLEATTTASDSSPSRLPTTLTPQIPSQKPGSAVHCGNCTAAGTIAAEHDDIPPGLYLIASPSAASYFVIPADLVAPLRTLLSGGTISDAVASCEAASSRKSRTAVRTLLSHIEFRNFYGSVTPEEHVPDGAMLHIYVTNKCNLRCKHCYMSSGLKLAHGEVGTDQRLRALDAFAQVHPGGLVTFSGGEALLDPDIFVLLRRAKELGLKTELYSNGLTINKGNISLVTEFVDDLQISLDGATTKAHEEIRGRRTFRRTLKAIRRLDSEAKSKPGFRYRLSFTLTPSNWRDIRDNLKQLLERLGLKAVNRILIGAGSGVGRASKNTRMYSTVEDMRRIESSVMHHLSKRGVVHLPIFSSNRYSRTCGQGATIAIGADGKVYPCNITDQPPIGSLTDSNLADTIQQVRRYVTSTAVDEVEGCNRCPIRYFCGGICRITNLRRTGSFNKSACTPAYKSAQIRALTRRYASFRLSADSYEKALDSATNQ